MLGGRGGNTADYKKGERFAYKEITGQDGQPSPYQLTEAVEKWNSGREEGWRYPNEKEITRNLRKAMTAQEREMENHPAGTKAAAGHQVRVDERRKNIDLINSTKTT